ncbi:DUF4124 domain-containing protein [Ottowia sp.]|uniref:DUF4124 domain-containing protein n=1 Tax=Ottowia sp. TaxID=1898956 RepID=UPI003A8986DF
MNLLLHFVTRHLPHLLAGGVLGLTGLAATAQSIYVCVDANGRRLTSDRPILACNDREQRELSPSGVTLRVISPTLTANERDARVARQRQEAADAQRARDAMRRDQALITRYPDRATHDADRKKELAQTQAVVDVAESRIADLAAARKVLDDEMEFYRKDPSKAPGKLRQSIESNAQDVEEQRRAIAGQSEERKRINARFDATLERLQPLWDAKAVATAVSPATAAAPSSR